MRSIECSGDLCKQLALTLARVMDLDEKRKSYHAWRVALLAYRLADRLIPDQSGLMFYSGLIHDLGGLGLSSQVLHKETAGPVLRHPQGGAELAKKLPGLEKGAEFILNHQERWDGTGYPRGVKGKDLSIGSQILQTADFVEMELSKPLAGSLVFALEILKPNAGSVFNPAHHKLLREVFQQEDLAAVYLWGKNPDEYIPPLIEKINWPESKQRISPDEILKLFSRLIDCKHKYTSGHSLRVNRYSFRVGEEMGLPQPQLELLEKAALLHDLGKAHLPVELLNKPGILNEEEMQRIQKHPVQGSEFLSQLSLLAPAAVVVAHHHERWDGKGYPGCLSGEEIPQLSRIIAVADAYDAMTSTRPYRPPLSLSEMEKELRENSGTQFDPQVIDVFTKKVLSLD